MKHHLVTSPVLVFVLAFAAGCGSTAAPAQGTERGACYPNSTCNAGLVCLSNVCVMTGADGGTSDTGNTADVPGNNDAAAVDVVDAGTVDDTGTDAGALDSGLVDSGGFDSGVADAGPADTGPADTGARDARNEAGFACPGAEIFHPGTEMRAVNTSVPFIGHAQAPDCSMLTGLALVWTDNLEGAIGTGEMFSYTFRVRGMHTVTLTATYAPAQTVTATVSFLIQ